MPFPAFNSDGDLPPGVYPGVLAEVLDHFGQGATQRQAVSVRLDRIYNLAKATGYLARFVIFGSYVTMKSEPRDVDIVMIMEDAFDVTEVPEETQTIFQHQEADARLGASIFWTLRSGALGGEQTMIEYWQVRREGGLRGIVEIVEEQ